MFGRHCWLYDGKPQLSFLGKLPFPCNIDIKVTVTDLNIHNTYIHIHPYIYVDYVYIIVFDIKKPIIRPGSGCACL